MASRLARTIHWVTLTALGALGVYSAGLGVAVPLVRSGLWDLLGWPAAISTELMAVPAWRFLIGYALIGAFLLSWTALFQRKAWALATFAIAVLLHLSIWILSASSPYANPAAGYIVIMFEGVTALGASFLYLGGYLKGRVIPPLRH